MEFTFPYRKERSKLFGAIFRPVILVEIKYKSEWISQRMLVDSGADISLIPRSIGDLLGFELKEDNIQEIKGVGESLIPVIIKDVNVRFCDVEFSAKVAWSLIEEVPSLFGRVDMFDRFEIKFRHYDKKVIFETK